MKTDEFVRRTFGPGRKLHVVHFDLALRCAEVKVIGVAKHLRAGEEFWNELLDIAAGRQASLPGSGDVEE